MVRRRMGPFPMDGHIYNSQDNYFSALEGEQIEQLYYTLLFATLVSIEPHNCPEAEGTLVEQS